MLNGQLRSGAFRVLVPAAEVINALVEGANVVRRLLLDRGKREVLNSNLVFRMKVPLYNAIGAGKGTGKGTVTTHKGEETKFWLVRIIRGKPAYAPFRMQCRTGWAYMQALEVGISPLRDGSDVRRLDFHTPSPDKWEHYLKELETLVTMEKQRQFAAWNSDTGDHRVTIPKGWPHTDAHDHKLRGWLDMPCIVSRSALVEMRVSCCRGCNGCSLPCYLGGCTLQQLQHATGGGVRQLLCLAEVWIRHFVPSSSTRRSASPAPHDEERSQKAQRRL
jgi:hypothetical protein